MWKTSLRKQPTFRDPNTGFPAKWRLRNKRRNSMLMTCHYPDLGIASDWLKKISYAAGPVRSTTQIWVATRHQNSISVLVFQTSFHQWWRRQMMAVFSGYTGDWTGDYLAWCVHTLMRNVTFWVLFYAIFTSWQVPVDKSARNAPGMKKFEKRTVNFFSKYSVFLIVEYLIFMVYFLFWAFQYSVWAIYNWPSKPDQEPVQRR